MAETATPRRMDAELQTMAKIDRLLAQHDERTQLRIVIWLCGRLRIGPFPGKADDQPTVPVATE